MVFKNSECPILAVLNFIQSFCTKLVGKIWKAKFWPFQINTCPFAPKWIKKFRMPNLSHYEFLPVFLHQMVGKNFEYPILSIPNFFQSFWPKLGIPKFSNNFGAFKKNGRNSERPKMGVLNFL